MLQRIILMTCCFIFILSPAWANDQTIIFSSRPVPKSLQKKMRDVTWYRNCPVRMKELALLNISYWGFDDTIHQGEMIVHQKLASEVLSIFQQLFQQHYPIERMELLYHYQGNDEKSMEANNTASFNCRAIIGIKNKFSRHSFGAAIDLNPKINPYIRGDIILPQNATDYLDRNQQLPGMIHRNDAVYRLFTQHGWRWGGNWESLTDYQHFERDLPEDDNTNHSFTS